ncbi:hypothetical protein [Streptomyces sp. bgisy153]|uniref:hypothetical protein n=1 Tax=Streptomyces sp. bgisy153 TaxID=3413793 RepID=UPI003D7517F7
MDTLLQPLSVHGQVMTLWAWHAYMAMHATPQQCRIRKAEARKSGTTTPESERAEFVELIHVRLKQLIERPRPDDETPPDSYASEIMSELRGFYPDPTAQDILDSFSSYLQYLTHSQRDPLRDLCEAAIQASLASYQHHQAAVPSDLRSLRVKINATWREEPPPPTFASPFLGLAWVESHCRGACCRDVETHLRAHVQSLNLTLSPMRFDSDTLASLPFVLFHECVSHVLQGLWDGTREASDPSSQFAEGWMDKVALAVFEDALTGVPPCSQVQLIPYPHPHSFFADASRRLYHERHNDTSVAFAYMLPASARGRGVEAAELLIQTFRRLSVGNPLEAFLRLSFALNASNISPARRDAFVEYVHEGLGPGVPLSQEVDLSAALRRFAHGASAHTVLSAFNVV